MPEPQDRAVRGRTSAGCPYFIERAEQVIDKQRHWAKNTSTAFYENEVATEQAMADLDHLDVRATIRDHIFGCFIEEASGSAVARHHR